MNIKESEKSPDFYFQNEYFGQKLREMRLKRIPRLSQEQLAKRLGISRSSYANYESGRVAVPLWLACAAASYFEVDIGFFLPNVDERMMQECEHLIGKYAERF